MTFHILRASLDFSGVGGSMGGTSPGFETPRTGDWTHIQRARHLTRRPSPPSVPRRSCGYAAAVGRSHGGWVRHAPLQNQQSNLATVAGRGHVKP